MDSLTQLRLTRELVDIDSTTGREGRGRQVPGLDTARTRVRRHRTAGQRGPFQRRRDARSARRGPLHALRLRAAVPSQPRAAADACTAADRAMRRARWSRRSRRPNGCAPAANAAIGLLFVVGEERGSDGAKLANTIAPGSRFLINGEPTDNRLGRATRGVYRVRLHASGRAAHSSQPELGESAIEKLIDVLVELRAMEWPNDPDLGTHVLHGRADSRRRRAERHSAGRGRRSDVSHRR